MHAPFPVSESAFSRAFQRSLDAQMLVADDRCVVAANRAAAGLLGVRPETLPGTAIEALLDGSEALWAARWPRLLVRGGGRGRTTARGADAPALEYTVTAAIDDGLHLLVLRPEPRKDLGERAATLGAVADASHDAVLLLDADGRVTVASARAAMVLGRSEPELLGRRLSDALMPDDRGRLDETVRLALCGEDVFQHDAQTRRPDGSQPYVTVNLAPLRPDGDERIAGVSVIVQDITSRKKLELELRHQAERDSLTGLFNRRRFEDDLHRATRLAARHGDEGAVILLDLDDFKRINDTHGHPSGDALLRSLAQALAGSTRDSDLAARLGGDEFAVLLPRVDSPSAGTAAAAKLLEAASVATAPWRVTASLGIARFGPPDAFDADAVLRAADEALYRAKEGGGNRLVAAGEDAPAGNA